MTRRLENKNRPKRSLLVPASDGVFLFRPVGRELESFGAGFNRLLALNPQEIQLGAVALAIDYQRGNRPELDRTHPCALRIRKHLANASPPIGNPPLQHAHQTAKGIEHHIRKAGRPTEPQKTIYTLLGIDWKTLPVCRRTYRTRQCAKT